LGTALLSTHTTLVPIPMEIRQTCIQAEQFVRNIEVQFRSGELLTTNWDQQRGLLTMMVTELTPIVDQLAHQIGELTAHITPGTNRNIDSAIWNIEHNNLVRMRRILSVCQKYADNLTE
jgi:hypothetical protein